MNEPPGPSGEAGDAPASTQVEQSSGCARVRFSPTLQQQSSLSPGGLDADFIVQYDVDLRDGLGDVQVRGYSNRHVHSHSVCLCYLRAQLVEEADAQDLS